MIAAMYSVYGVKDDSNRLVYIGYRRYDDEYESYSSYTYKILLRNKSKYLDDINYILYNRKDDNVVIFKDNIESKDAAALLFSTLCYCLLPKYNDVKKDDKGLYYFLALDEKDEEKKCGCAIGKCKKDNDIKLSLNEQLLLLS